MKKRYTAPPSVALCFLAAVLCANGANLTDIILSPNPGAHTMREWAGIINSNDEALEQDIVAASNTLASAIAAATPEDYETVSSNATAAIVAGETNAADIAAIGTNAINPDMLLDMIYANAASIASGSGRTPETFTGIYATSNSAALNGSNLWNAVTDSCAAGNDAVFVLDAGAYLLPETLSISNAHIEIVSGIQSSAIKPASRDYLSYGGVTEITPSYIPPVYITGNIDIYDDADACLIMGISMTNSIINEYADSFEDRLDPNVLMNCYVKGALCRNTTNALRLDGCYIYGYYSSGAEAIHGGDIFDSVVVDLSPDDIGRNSLTRIRGIEVQPFNKPMVFKDSWLFDTAIGLDFKSALVVDGCVVDGAYHFPLAYSGAVAESVKVYNTRFSGTGEWGGVEDSASTEFRNCIGVSTTITNHASTIITFCTDSTGAVIE